MSWASLRVNLASCHQWPVYKLLASTLRINGVKSVPIRQGYTVVVVAPFISGGSTTSFGWQTSWWGVPFVVVVVVVEQWSSIIFSISFSFYIPLMIKGIKLKLEWNKSQSQLKFIWYFSPSCPLNTYNDSLLYQWSHICSLWATVAE